MNLRNAAGRTNTDGPLLFFLPQPGPIIDVIDMTHSNISHRIWIFHEETIDHYRPDK